MSTIPNSPIEEETPSPHQDSRQEEFKRPDLIIVEVQKNQDQEKLDLDGENKGSQSQKESAQGAFSLRFFCFLGLIFCLIFGIGILLGSTVMTVLAALSLFRNQNLNESLYGLWKLSMHTLVAGFGFVLGLISPTLGLGLIALYFSISGEVIDNNLLRKIIQRSFQDL